MSAQREPPKTAGVWRTLRETPLSAHVVLVGIFINQIAAFVQLFLVLFLTAKGFTAEQAGIALGFYSVGAIIGTFGGGALADLLGPRWTIVVSTGTQGLFTFSLTLFHSLVPICVAAGVSGDALVPAAVRAGPEAPPGHDVGHAPVGDQWRAGRRAAGRRGHERDLVE